MAAAVCGGHQASLFGVSRTLALAGDPDGIAVGAGGVWLAVQGETAP